jgi:hypothetical protein
MKSDISNSIQKVTSVAFRQLRDIHSISGINSLILSVCLVDTLAGFYTGCNGQRKGKGNKERYKEFADKYLPDYCDIIYEIRCDLAHSFSNTLAKYYFVDNREFTKTFGCTVNILEKQTFNIDHFRDSLSKALEMYFFHLNTDVNLQTNFSIRFNYANILDDGQIGTVLNLNGKMVSKYEELDSLPGLDLKIAIVDPTRITE